jgi:hypothetical protein
MFRIQPRGRALLLCIFGALFIVSCYTEYRPFDRHQRGAFDPANADTAVELVEDFAKKHSLGLEQKDREQMSFLTEDLPAFFSFLYLEPSRDSVITVSNVGVGTVLDITLIHGDNADKKNEVALFEALLDLLSSNSLVSDLSEVPPSNET